MRLRVSVKPQRATESKPKDGHRPKVMTLWCPTDRDWGITKWPPNVTKCPTKCPNHHLRRTKRITEGEPKATKRITEGEPKETKGIGSPKVNLKRAMGELWELYLWDSHSDFSVGFLKATLRGSNGLSKGITKGYGLTKGRPQETMRDPCVVNV